jgi:RNA polymerase sigma factor (sigma-70 family)
LADSSSKEIDQRLRPALQSFFMRRVRDHAEAEDLTQEVLIRLAQTDAASLRSAEAYMFQIAANLLRDRARRDKVRADYREQKLRSDQGMFDPLDPFRVVSGRLNLATVGAAIASLPEKTRRIFVLYRIEHVDKQAIADSFGCTTRSVEMHIQQALQSLLTTMKEEL